MFDWLHDAMHEIHVEDAYEKGYSDGEKYVEALEMDYAYDDGYADALNNYQGG